MSTLHTLRSYVSKSRRLLDDADIVRLRWLFVAILAMAALEVAGIASILPFMYLVSDPDAVQRNALLRWFYEFGGFSSERSLLIWAGAAVLAMFTVSTTFTALTTWQMNRSKWIITHRLSMRLLANFGTLPYEFFLANSSATLLKKVLSDVNGFVSGVIAAAIRFVAYTTLSVSIFLLLVAANPKLALSALVIFGGAHVLFQVMLHGYFRRLGVERMRLARERFTSFSEAITGIKAIRSFGVYPYFVRRFESASAKYSVLIPKYGIVAMLPRFAIELLAFGAILGTVVFWLARGENFGDKLPMLTLFALAAYRLLPALNTAATSFSQVSNNLAVIDEVHEDFRDDLYAGLRIAETSAEAVPFERRIELRDVRFRYASSSADVLTGISLAFERGAKVALVGPTGSGKSTLIDIMVGLLLPTSGALLVDGEAVTAQNAAGWRRNVAYVPQDGFLFDQSIASNIAFGVPAADIDMDRVRWAARIAQIDDFISGELPEQYDTLVGERGVRLSGGQRQRVGLARAFYRRPPVLLLDEATSALDGATEAAVMAGVYEEFPDVTVIMIAHRLSTVRSADRVFLIDRGALRASGTYDELLAGDAQFRGMVELSGPGDGEPA